MFISGFTFIRNAVKYDYPVVEAISSILPVCDEFIVPDDGAEGIVHRGGHATEYHCPFRYASKQLLVKSNINKLCAGVFISFLSFIVIRGINNPCEVELISSIAELSAGAPFIFIEIPFCEKAIFRAKQ